MLSWKAFLGQMSASNHVHQSHFAVPKRHSRPGEGICRAAIAVVGVVAGAAPGADAVVAVGAAGAAIAGCR